jgi:hypothetical protein
MIQPENIELICVVSNISFSQRSYYRAERLLQRYIPVLQLNEECHAGKYPTRPVGEMIQENRERYRILDTL